MAVLDRFRQFHYEATSKVSENTRTLALAAIGIVWLLKRENDGAYEIPESLLVPLALVALAMALDFLQYVYRSIVWHVIFRRQERRLFKNEIDETTELYVNPAVNFFGYLFFYGKVGCLAFAYWKLASYFLGIIKWV